MLKELLDLQNPEQLLNLKEINLEDLLMDICVYDSDIKEGYKHFPLHTEYVFTLGEIDNYKLTLFIFSNVESNISHQFAGPISVINGEAIFSVNSAKNINQPYPWLKKIALSPKESVDLKIGDSYKLNFNADEVVTLNIAQENTVFLQFIDSTNSNEMRLLNNYYFKPEGLNPTSRKLIKLARNFYLDKKNKDQASDKLFKVLEKLDEQQLFIGHFVENYTQSIPRYKAYYIQFMNDKFSEKFFKEMHGDSNE
jgi:hypothetical protein